jgi:hypothetical protein
MCVTTGSLLSGVLVYIELCMVKVKIEFEGMIEKFKRIYN